MKTLALCWVAALLALSAPAPALAQAAARPDAELVEVEKKLKDRAREEARLRDEAKDREREIAELRQRLIEAADALQGFERDLARVTGDIRKLEREEESIKESLLAQQVNLGEVLAALQMIERTRPPALLVAPDDASQAARLAMLLADVAPQIDARAAALRLSLTRLAEVRASLDLERDKLRKTNEDVLSRRSALAGLLRDKQRENQVVHRLAAAAQSETAALAARASDLREVLSRLDRLARSVTPRLKPPRRAVPAPGLRTLPARPPAARDIFRPARPFSSARGLLSLPVVGSIVAGFGQSKPEGGKSEGLRIAAADKAIVTAPFEAKVAFARPWARRGNLVVLDVGSGYHIVLMGVGAFLVEEGQSIAAGEPVATMSGGRPELEFEIRKDGAPINPSLWLSKGNSVGGSP